MLPVYKFVKGAYVELKLSDIINSDEFKTFLHDNLKDENIEIKQKDEDGNTALMSASEKGHQEIVQMLLENENINLNSKF